MQSLCQVHFNLFGESSIYLEKKKIVLLLRVQQGESVWSVPVAAGQTHGNTSTVATLPFKKKKKIKRITNDPLFA